MAATSGKSSRVLDAQRLQIFEDRLTFVVEMKGKMIRVKSNFCPHPPPRKRKGSTIKEFTKQARMRLLRFSATVDWESGIGGRFITLTYPDERVRHSKEDRKKHLYLFHRYMENHLQVKIPMLWRVEWIERKSGIFQGKAAPHIHVLTFRDQWIAYWKVNEFWKKAIDWDDYVRTECTKIESEKHAGHYVSKYCAKYAGLPSLVNVLKGNSTGRHYGYKRATQIPRCKGVRLVGVSRHFRDALKAIAVEDRSGFDAASQTSFTLLGDRAERWQEVLLQLALDEGLVVEYDS